MSLSQRAPAADAGCVSDVPKIRLTWSPSVDNAWLKEAASSEPWNSGWTQFLRIRRENGVPHPLAPYDPLPALPRECAGEALQPPSV